MNAFCRTRLNVGGYAFDGAVVWREVVIASWARCKPIGPHACKPHVAEPGSAEIEE